LTLWRASLQLALRARGRARQQQRAFTGVLGECGGALKFGAGFIGAAKAGEQVAAHTGQQVVVSQGGFVSQAVDVCQSGRRAECHGERHSTIQLDHR
jgi:hypothetical protein